uniref:WH2 domain-containing protein n=1 Tax=Globodera pallida TaxID=36090 RepID=A0A183C767_GLOPA
MKMYDANSTSPGSVGGENSKSKQKFIGTKRAVANAIVKGHLNLNGSSRKRSAEPRPHPAKLLNKRYWDDVRAGRVCPPAASAEGGNRTTKLLAPIKEEIGSKSRGNQSEKRKASVPFDVAKQNAKNNAKIQNCTPIMQNIPTSVTYSSSNLLNFHHQNDGIVSFGSALPPPQTRPLLRFGTFLPPPQDIMRPHGTILLPPTDAFIQPPPPPQFASALLDSSSTRSMNVVNMDNISRLMMLQQQHQHQQKQFRNSAESTANATWTLFEMLAKGTSNGQQMRHEPPQQPPIFAAQNTPEAVKNASKIIAPQPTTGCDAESPASWSRSSESDAQIDELMDQIAQKYGGNTQITGLQTQNCQSQNEAKCRFCFVPIPMPVPIPVPVSTDFILKHFGTNEPIRNRK